MTHAEYCALEREATVKHEYIAGEVFAMTGGTLEHSRLAGKITQLLLNRLDGGPCRVFTSDARVRIEAADVDVYPDVSVICGPPPSSTTTRCSTPRSWSRSSRPRPRATTAG